MNRLELHVFVASFIFAAPIPAGAQHALPNGAFSWNTVRSPQVVVGLAARELAGSGYEITTADGAAGVVVARREKKASEFGEDVRCSFNRNLATWKRVAFTVTVTAIPGDSTSVQVRGLARSFDNQEGRTIGQPESFSDCVSAGVIEKRIMDASR